MIRYYYTLIDFLEEELLTSTAQQDDLDLGNTISVYGTDKLIKTIAE